MTAEQFERWKDVSLRFARHGWPGMTEARKNRLIGEVESFLENIESEEYIGIKSWDQGAGYVCDWFDEVFDVPWVYGCNDRYEEDNDWDQHSRFCAQLRCCLRIGIDLAAEPSAGVLGFTKGDLERCFDGQIPEWILAELPGLSEAPSDAGVWL
jgi:hypothetical protein